MDKKEINYSFEKSLQVRRINEIFAIISEMYPQGIPLELDKILIEKAHKKINDDNKL